MRIEEIVGRRIREAREARGLTQDEFGRLVAELLDRPWPRQAQSHAEKGGRSFTAAEIMAFAVIIDCDPAELYRLPADVQAVELPGLMVSRDRLERARGDVPAGSAELRARLIRLVEAADQLSEAGADMKRSAMQAQDELDRFLMAHPQ